jgi:TRAP-type C4-dicarboxylate transport system permease small subunit
LGVPMTCIYLAIPFSFIFMVLNIANNMIKFLRNHRSLEKA